MEIIIKIQLTALLFAVLSFGFIYLFNNEVESIAIKGIAVCTMLGGLAVSVVMALLRIWL